MIEEARDRPSLTLAAIREDQRPRLTYYSAPEHIKLNDASLPLAICTPTDALEDLPHLVSLEVLYELLTKEALATSGVPTPPGEVISISVPPDPSTMEQGRVPWFKTEVDRIL